MTSPSKEQLMDVWVYTCGVDHGFFLMSKRKTLGLQNWDGTMVCPCGKPIKREDWTGKEGVTYLTAEETRDG